MKFRPIAAVLLRQLYLLRGSPVRLFPLVTWVTIDILVWGFLTRYLNSVSASGVDFAPTLLGGVLLWDFSTRVMHGVSTAFLEDVWSRNLIAVFASPLSISEYLTGLVSASVLNSSLSLAVMLLLATTIFHLQFFSLGIPLAAFLIVLFGFGIALGVFASAMVMRLGPSSEWLLWPLAAVISPFAAVFYPLSVLPVWMQWIGRALPPSYVFEGMRELLAGRAFPEGLLLQGLTLTLLDLLLAALLFRSIHGKMVRSGLLVRYSAESV